MLPFLGDTSLLREGQDIFEARLFRSILRLYRQKLPKRAGTFLKFTPDFELANSHGYTRCAKMT